MKRSLLLLFLFLSTVSQFTLSAQKTFKAVCDRSDGKVKIVDGEERSPDQIPLKGGFPFYQVAENWVRENYPAGTCDPAAATKQNQAATPAAPQQQTSQNTAGPSTAEINNFFNGGNTPATTAVQQQQQYHNSSVYFSLLFSNLGSVYNVDPPLIPGMCAGFDQVLGNRIYGGTGIHISALIGKTDDGAGVSSFYNINIPLYAGYRQNNGNRVWGVDLGIAANTALRPVTSDSDLHGEIASNFSLCALTRVRAGSSRLQFEFGVDMWLTDILSSEEGFRMTVLSVGLRHLF